MPNKTRVCHFEDVKLISSLIYLLAINTTLILF